MYQLERDSAGRGPFYQSRPGKFPDLRRPPDDFRKSPRPIRHTRSSVTGKAAHTPSSFPRAERRKARGMIRINPLSREIICAGRGLSVDVKYTDSTILKPANMQPVK